MAGVAAIVVAAGQGLRAGGDLPKQFRRIGGEAMLNDRAELPRQVKPNHLLGRRRLDKLHAPQQGGRWFVDAQQSVNDAPIQMKRGREQ